MTLTTIIGTQWGDEGKGKIVDLLADNADYVVRFQGGHNAGHTLVIDGTSYKLSLLPSGIIRPQTHSLIGNGVVIDPFALLDEIERVRAQGLDISPKNLSIALNAHMILPIHQRLDQLSEKTADKSKIIGTTGRGIGPAYTDKVARRGILTADLFDLNRLKDRLTALINHHNITLNGYDFPPENSDDIYEQLTEIAPKITPYLADVADILNTAYRNGSRILFEGAQGTMLDIDHGTYPFVTSSNTISAQAAIGTGLGAARKSHVIGLAKAYTTRVGNGPFPTEQNNDIGETLRKNGCEFGTVTGRERRCGWFDAALVRQACILNDIDGLALTKLDVLDGFETLKICSDYDQNGNPIYEEMAGWGAGETTGKRDYQDLPLTAKAYIKRIEELTGTPISIIATGAERDDTIVRPDITSDTIFNRAIA